MSDCKCAEYCVDIETAKAADLGVLMSKLLDDIDRVKEAIASKVLENRAALTIQFDQLFR
jgi:hypothetical protein